MLDGLIAALLALAVLVAATGGGDIEVGPLALRSHSAWRVLAIAASLFGIRVWRSRSSEPGARPALSLVEGIPDLVRLCLLTLILLSIGYWFKFLLATVGGADSYGYATAARQLASGGLVAPAPIAEWLSSPDRLALATPLGWAPWAGGHGIVPKYPLGFPALLALAGTIAGPNAIFFVSPAMGLLTLWLVYRFTRRWGDQTVALLATALVAWNPVFLTYAKQPMSDVAAAAWMMLALYHAGSPVRAGLSAGAAFLTRPALIVAGGVIPAVTAALKCRPPGSLKCRPPGAPKCRPPGAGRIHHALIAGGIVAAAVAVQMSLQAFLFGSAFASGYGSAEALFSVAAFPDNVEIYARQSWIALGGLWIAALGAGIWVLRGRRALELLAVAAAVALPYLFYLRFDHWETLRFLLPGLVPLSILAAFGVAKTAESVRVPAAPALIVVLFALVFAVRSERFMGASSVWEIQALEARYPLAAQWMIVNTPPQSVALAMQHSGSLRWYSGRQTLRWDLMKPDELVSTIGELEAHGATVYAVLEGIEQKEFDAKFSPELARLTVDPVGRVRNVSFLRLTSR